MGQIGVHRPGSVGDQQGKLVRVPGFAAFQNHGNRRALFDVDQVLLQSGHSKQGGNGQMVFIHAFVGQDQDIDALRARLIAGGKESIQRGPQARFFGI